MKLLILGDLFYDYDYIAEDIYHISNYIKNENYNVILNLEGPITNNHKRKIEKRGEHLCQSKSVLDVLSILNVKGVTLSNNHTFDYLEDGYKDTVKVLEENNIQYTGVVKSNREKPKCIKVTDKDDVYEIYAGTDPFEESFCRSKTVGCALISDLLVNGINERSNSKKIAFLHTGFEYNTVPTIRTIKECRKLVDNGFDIVICSHPHIVQPYEEYKGKFIFYSLGNFYFSSFRDEFSNKKIHGKEDGYCSLGYGIQIDGDKISVIGINYDVCRKSSFLMHEVSLEELPQNNGVMYKRYYYKNRNNHNLLLTGNCVLDFGKMAVLNCLYKIYRKVKHLD